MERYDRGADDHVGALEAVVVVPNAAGLHTRSAAALIRESARFRSAITVLSAGGTASTRSMMELLRLGVRQGDTVRIRVTGDDAEAALGALRALIESGFGEG